MASEGVEVNHRQKSKKELDDDRSSPKTSSRADVERAVLDCSNHYLFSSSLCARVFIFPCNINMCNYLSLMPFSLDKIGVVVSTRDMQTR